MRVSRFVLFLAVVLVPAFADAEESKTGSAAKQPVKIGLFEAIDQGLIEAKIVAKNSLDGRVTVKSKADVPLQIQLPEAFAAVPLHQFDDMGGDVGGGGGRSSRGSGGSSRNSSSGSSGGSFQSSGGGFGSSGGYGSSGGGMWNIAPEHIIRQDVKTVCLEHGKREPARHIDYELRPIETVSDKKEVQMLCNLVGSGAVNQKAAQAAVWHYANGMSWEELSNKRVKARIDSPFTVPYFTREQMLYAMNLGKKVEEKAAADKETKKEKVIGGSGE